jgi:acyl-CoA dehydrogenase
MEERDFDAVLHSLRDFIRNEVMPREEEIEETDQIPGDLRAKAAELGLFGYAIPEEYGGLGLTPNEDIRLAMLLGRTSLAFRSMFGTNNGIAGQVIVADGTPEQKNHYLPRMASGEIVASFALTEPEAGSDPSAIVTRAVREGDEYIINGTKRFITNAPEAGLFVTFARTDPAQKGGRGISVILVDAGTPGVSVGPPDKKMGQSGAHTAEVFFDDARVPASALVGGQEGAGYASGLRSLVRGRLHIAGMAVGLAERLVEESVTYAANRTQGGRTIGDYQLVQGLIADSQAELYAGRAMAIEAARQYASGEDRRLGPSCAKYFCTEMAGRVADRAVQIFGGMGYMRGVAVERMYRDARLLRIYEGTSQIQQVIIARELLRAASRGGAGDTA